MAKGMYIGINNKAYQIDKAYIGINGKAMKIEKIYIGVDNKARLVWSSDGNYPYIGAVYPYVSSSGTNKYIAYRTWDRSLATFSDQNLITWSNMYNNNSNYFSFASSKDGRVLVWVFAGSTPTVRAALWNENTKTYDSVAVADTSNIHTLLGVQTGTINLCRNTFISDDGKKFILMVNSETGVKSSSAYYSKFIKAESYMTNCYLLFFDINQDTRTQSFTRGISVYGESFVEPSSVYWTSDYYTGFSEDDEDLLFISGYAEDSSYYQYVYNVDINNMTATRINLYSSSAPDATSNSITMGISNNGKYIQICPYDGDRLTLYHNGTTFTQLTGITTNLGYPGIAPQNMYIPEFNKNVMYMITSDTIYCYKIDGANVTSLGKIGLTSSSSAYYHVRTMYGITDMNNEMVLFTGMVSTTRGGTSHNLQSAVAEISFGTGGLLTAFKTSNVLGECRVAGYSCYNVAKFVDKDSFAEIPFTGTELQFTSSTTWTVPADVTSISIFAVGGGGGAGGSYRRSENLGEDESGRLYYHTGCCEGASGAGGYTTTVENVAVTPGDKLLITIGAGGTGGTGYYYSDDSGSNGKSTSNISSGSRGGTTTVITNSGSGTTLCSAAGGNGGNKTSMTSLSIGACTAGASGGSGSGATAPEAWGYTSNNGDFNLSPWDRGVDGSDGASGTHASSYFNSTTAQGGSGQGTTTRAFKNARATLYASAGKHVGITPTGNTGNGGRRDLLSPTETQQNSGDNGIVIIRFN